MIVAIDGPAGSGKSSTARAVAEHLGFRHLESGALYRGLTFAALRAGIPTEHWDALSHDQLVKLAVRAEPDGRGFRILVGDQEVSHELRSSDVNRHVSHMSRIPAVRAWLLDGLRAAASGADLVADGRDMGTVVFPDADVKVFLTADIETRARRRLREDARSDDPDSLLHETARLAARDRSDSERPVAPLRIAPDATRIDTTNLDFDAQVERIVGLVLARRERPPA